MPATIGPGATFKLAEIGETQRQYLVEGINYLSNFTDMDIARVKQQAFDADQQFVFGGKGKDQYETI